MSICISRHGEYSSHLPSTDDQWACELCGALREDALRAEVTRLRAIVTEAALETYTPDGSERFVAQFHRVLAERNALRADR